jgi:hypothetical protein
MTVMMSGYGAGWPAWGIGLMWIGMIAVLAFLIWVAYVAAAASFLTPAATPVSSACRFCCATLWWP